MDVDIEGGTVVSVTYIDSETIEVVVVTPTDPGLYDIAATKEVDGDVYMAVLEDAVEVTDSYCSGLSCGACVADIDCVEGDACTADVCDDGMCVHDPIGSCCAPFPDCGACTLGGDVTGNGVTNVTDVVCGNQVSLWLLAGKTEPAPECLARPLSAADLDCSGNVDVTDVVLLIDVALGATLDPSIDADGDGCHDACGGAQ